MGNPAISNQLEVGLIMVRAIKSICKLSLPLSVYGPIIGGAAQNVFVVSHKSKKIAQEHTLQYIKKIGWCYGKTVLPFLGWSSPSLKLQFPPPLNNDEFIAKIAENMGWILYPPMIILLLLATLEHHKCPWWCSNVALIFQCVPPCRFHVHTSKNPYFYRNNDDVFVCSQCNCCTLLIEPPPPLVPFSSVVETHERPPSPMINDEAMMARWWWWDNNDKTMTRWCWQWDET